VSDTTSDSCKEECCERRSRGEKTVGVDGVEFGIDSVDAADTLNEASGIPRYVVIDNYVRLPSCSTEISAVPGPT
jgi:hypothetical protein